MAKRARKEKPAGSSSKDVVLELLVRLEEGPITEAFAKENPEVTRTIRIRGGQKLADLHEAIFEAFERFDEHMYEFQFGGKGPMDPKARRYVLPMDMEESMDDTKPAGDVTRTTLTSLGLNVGDHFGYWFDFGDDWWHRIEVAAILDPAPPGTYPKVTARLGDSPPQYPNADEEDLDEDFEDEEDDDFEEGDLDGEEFDDEFDDDDDDDDAEDEET